MEEYEKRIQAAQGYSELGMTNEALDELDGIGAPICHRPELIEMRLLILLHARRWEEALDVARVLCKTAPDSSAGYIHTAFCLHELGFTTEAKAILLSGPPVLLQEPTYHYNLACYECILGNLESAQAHLETTFSMDKKFREFARTDPDLAKLRAAK